MEVTPELIAASISVLVLFLVALTGVGLLNSRRRRAQEKRGIEGWPDLLRTVSGIEGRLDRLIDELVQLRAHVTGHIQHVGIVHYDAFRDVGGHLSFSVALLDARRNGVIISILNGRDGSRGYAKLVTEGQTSSALSEEEQEAIARALSARGSQLGGATLP